MIPLPPHRTKGPGTLGATGPGGTGPFGLWPDAAAAEDRHPRPTSTTGESEKA